jgi:type I restriction enzyme S subunit
MSSYYYETVNNSTQLRQFPTLIPPLPEQRKIAAILTTWDEALEKLDALIAAQERRKRGLMQRLLKAHRNSNKRASHVAECKASELFTNRSERNTTSLEVLSVTQDQGVLARKSLERRITHDESNVESYKVVHKGDFIISLRSFQGGLEYSGLNGAISPAYHVIRPIKEIDHAFFRHYFKSHEFISRLAVATIGIRDGKQISFTDFGFIKLPFLPLETQQRIGIILDTADAEIHLLRAQREALDRQKRGLMQRLLTGK